MTALWIFISTFALTFALGMQSQHVNKGHYWAAFSTSYLINAANLVVLKSVPDANWVQMFAYLNASPFAIVFSMWAHRKYFKKEG